MMLVGVVDVGVVGVVVGVVVRLMVMEEILVMLEEMPGVMLVGVVDVEVVGGCG